MTMTGYFIGFIISIVVMGLTLLWLDKINEEDNYTKEERRKSEEYNKPVKQESRTDGDYINKYVIKTVALPDGTVKKIVNSSLEFVKHQEEKNYVLKNGIMTLDNGVTISQK